MAVRQATSVRSRLDSDARRQVPEGPQKYAIIATGKLTSDGSFGSGKAYIVALVAGVCRGTWTRVTTLDHF